MDINKYFNERDIESIEQVLKQHDAILNYLILGYAKDILLTSSNVEDVKFGEEILIKAISSCKGYIHKFNLYNSTNERVRFNWYVKAIYDFKKPPGKLLKDKDNKIIKIIEKRRFFDFLEEHIRNYSSYKSIYDVLGDQNRVKLFENLLTSGTIGLKRGNAIGEFTQITLFGILFEENIDILVNTDYLDYLYNERNFSFILNDMYEEGMLKFRKIKIFKDYLSKECYLIKDRVPARKSLIKRYYGNDGFSELYKISK